MTRQVDRRCLEMELRTAPSPEPSGVLPFVAKAHGLGLCPDNSAATHWLLGRL